MMKKITAHDLDEVITSTKVPLFRDLEECEVMSDNTLELTFSDGTSYTVSITRK